MKKALNSTAKIAIRTRSHYDDNDDAKFVTIKRWEKNGKCRAYINNYKGRTIGYIDRADKQYTQMDNQGLTKDEINGILEDFTNEYEF